MTTRAMVLGVAALAAACGRPGARSDTARAADRDVPVAVPSAPAAAKSDTSASRPASPAPARTPAPSRTPPPKPPATPPPGRTALGDTLRGKPAVVGSAPFTQVALRPASGGSVTITGPLAKEIGRASGADVWVRGTRSDRGFEAAEYRVRTVDGVPALDGVLVVDGERTHLRLADGTRRSLRSAPAALRAEAGARVWVTGGVDQPVAAFGILRPRN